MAPGPRAKWPWLLVALLGVSVSLNIVWLVRPGRAVEPDPVAPAAALPAPARQESSVVPPALTAYAALGTYVAANNRIPDLGWTTEQFAAFAAGLRACYLGRPYPFDEAADQLRQEIDARVRALTPAAATDPIEEYFTLLRERENVQRTESNLHYRVTEEGTGEPPAAGDTVVVSYSARLPGGEPVPSLTRPRARVRVGDLLPGLTEGLQRVKPSGKALIYVPPPLSFGNGRWPEDVPRGVPVAFFVELHEVIRDDW